MRKIAIRVDTIEYILLVLFSVGFYNMSNYWLILLFGVAILLKRDRVLLFLPVEGMILGVCFLTFYFIYVIYYDDGLSLYSISTLFIGPIIGFLIGEFLVRENQNKLKNIIIMISVCFVLHGAANLSQAGVADIWYDQQIIDIWTGELVTATLNGAYFTGTIVLFFWFLFKAGLHNKLLGVFALGLLIWSSVTTAERTLIVNFLLSVVAFFYGKAIFGYRDKKTIQRLMSYTLLIIVIIFILVSLFLNNAFGIQTLFMQTSLGTRLSMLDSLTQDGRGTAMMDVLKELWNHPMGNLRDMFYAHNLIIDTGRMCGVIPMFFMIAYIIAVLKRMVAFCRNSNIQSKIRMLVLIFYFAFLVNFMVEPVLEGMPMMFIAFCIINGGVFAVYNGNRCKKSGGF